MPRWSSPSSSASVWLRRIARRRFTVCRASAKSPSKLGSMARMRSSRGGCVAKRLCRTPVAKSMWETSAARGFPMRLPCVAAPMILSAAAMPSGLRVNWTEDESARYSRWRETIAWIRREQRTPSEPSAHTTPPKSISPSAIAAPLSFFLRERPENRRIWTPPRKSRLPISEMQRMPKRTPTMRMFRRMSPLRMWLNSWPTTACSSSRLSRSSVPRVTAIAASFEA